MILKNKALTKCDRQLAAHAEAAHKAEDLAEHDGQCAVQAHAAHEAENVTANWLLMLRLLVKLKITLMKMYGNPLLLNHQLMIKSVVWSWTLACAI